MNDMKKRLLALGLSSFVLATAGMGYASAQGKDMKQLTCSQLVTWQKQSYDMAKNGKSLNEISTALMPKLDNVFGELVAQTYISIGYNFVKDGVTLHPRDKSLEVCNEIQQDANGNMRQTIVTQFYVVIDEAVIVRNAKMKKEDHLKKVGLTGTPNKPGRSESGALMDLRIQQMAIRVIDYVYAHPEMTAEQLKVSFKPKLEMVIE